METTETQGAKGGKHHIKADEPMKRNEGGIEKDVRKGQRTAAARWKERGGIIRTKECKGGGGISGEERKAQKTEQQPSHRGGSFVKMHILYRHFL